MTSDGFQDYGEPPYRRTIWRLHRQQGRLVLEERVLGADERTGEFSREIRHTWTPVEEMDYPPPAKFEAVGHALEEGGVMDLEPAADYWDDLDDEPADYWDDLEAIQESEAYLSRRAGESVAEFVIPAVATALRRAINELASESGGDHEIAAAYLIEALTRYLAQDASLMSFALVKWEHLNAAAARAWFEANLPDEDT